MRKIQSLGVLALTLLWVACNSWPIIIATAQGIALIDPAAASLSATSVTLLQTAEVGYNAYHANPTDTTRQNYANAIEAIETQIPADLAALKLPATVAPRVEAAVNIILDWVEAKR